MTSSPGSPRYAETLLNARFNDSIPRIVRDANLEKLRDWANSPHLSWNHPTASQLLDCACARMEEYLEQRQSPNGSIRTTHRIAVTLLQCIDAARNGGLETAAPWISLALNTIPQPAES